MPTKITTILPVYNEEKILKKQIKNFIIFYKNKGIELEIIFVDNGSTDHTEIIIDQLKVYHAIIKKIRLPNRELGTAIKKGVEQAQNEIIFVSGIDFPFGYKNLKNLAKYINNYDIILGSKDHPKSTIKIPLLRKAFSKFSNKLIRFLFNLKTNDTQGSVLFKKSITKKYFHLMNSKNAWFETQLILYGNLSGAKIKEIPVNYIARKNSKMKIKDGLMLLIDLFKEYPRYRIYKKTKNENRKK